MEKEKYYKIGDVASMIDVSASTIRYWETEFHQIKPLRTPGGMRKYRPEDVEMCKLIKELLREKDYSIECAKAKIKEHISTGSIDYIETLFTCNSTKDALRLLSELKIKCEMDAYAVARIEALEGWINKEIVK